MKLKQTIAIVGPGTMGGAIIAGLLKKKLILPERLTAVHRRRGRCQELREKHGIRASTRNADAAKADVIVLAVKPKDMPRVLGDLKGLVDPGALVISIAAGVSIRTISRGLSAKGRTIANVVRCMPNTPGQIGKGITGWTANGADAAHLACARKILGALGKEKFFASEDMLDVVTALSGTGPAYFYLVTEAMVDAAVREGMSRADATGLVLATAEGAAAFALRYMRQHLAALRNQVTSPAGTTAEALHKLEEGGLRTIFANAIRAACEQSAKMGKKAEEAAGADEEEEG